MILMPDMATIRVYFETTDLRVIDGLSDILNSPTAPKFPTFFEHLP